MEKINTSYLKGKLEDYCRKMLKPGKGRKYICPVCGDPDGVGTYAAGKKWKCFAGKHESFSPVVGGDIFDLAGLIIHKDRSELRAIAAHIVEELRLAAGELDAPEDPAKAKAEAAAAAAELEKKKAYFRKQLEMARKQSAGGLSEPVKGFLADRGIAGYALDRLQQVPTVEILSLHSYGKDFVVFAPAAENRYIPALSNSGGFYLKRDIKPKDKDERYKNSAGSVLPALFANNSTRKGPAAGVLAVTEGCFDAGAFFLSGCSALSLNSASNIELFQTYLTSITAAGFKAVIAAGDSDTSGQNMDPVIISACAAAGVPCVPLDYGNLADLSKNGKIDPADLWKNGKTDLLKAAIRDAAKACKKGILPPADPELHADAALAALPPASNPAQASPDEARAAAASSVIPAEKDAGKAPFKLQTAALPPAEKGRETVADQIGEIAKVLNRQNSFYMQGDALSADFGHILRPVGTCELLQALEDIKAASPEVLASCKYSAAMSLLKAELLTKAKMAGKDLEACPLDAHSIACKTHIFELVRGTDLKITPKAEYTGRPVRTEAAFSFLPATKEPPKTFRYFIESITAGMSEAEAALQRLYLYLLVACSCVPWISTSVRALFWLCGQPHTGKTELLRLMQEIAGENCCLWVDDSRRLDNRFALANVGRAHLALFDDSGAKVNEAVFKQLSQAGGFTSEAKGRNPITIRHAVAAVCTSNGLPASKGDPAMANRWIYLTINNLPEKPLPDLAERLKAEKDNIASYCLYVLKKWLPDAPERIDKDKRLLRQYAEKWAEGYTDAEEIAEFWAECVEPQLQRGRNVLPISEIQETFIAWNAESAYSSEYIDYKAEKLLRTWGADFRRIAEQKGGKIGTARTEEGAIKWSLTISK